MVFEGCKLGLILLPTVLAYYCECCADTWGSEVGILSSTPFLLFLPWKPVRAGLLLTLLYSLLQPSSSVDLIPSFDS